ncbi:hypothetical protein [Nannocystis pusilla]|uniref:hypothetical protein n=1 Tax=Nannocystis pusilla TaxID=889268 RepID=UPI003DA4D2CB
MGLHLVDVEAVDLGDCNVLIREWGDLRVMSPRAHAEVAANCRHVPSLHQRSCQRQHGVEAPCCAGIPLPWHVA